MKVVGIRKVSYVSKKTGNQVNGYEIHGFVKSNRPEVIGLLTEVQYLSARCVDENGGELPGIEDDVEFFYNKFGSCESYRITPKAKA